MVEFPDLAIQSATLDVLQLKVEMLFVLERAVDAHQERAFATCRLWLGVRAGFFAWVLFVELLDLELVFCVSLLEVLQHFPLVDDVVYVFHLGHALLPKCL